MSNSCRHTSKSRSQNHVGRFSHNKFSLKANVNVNMKLWDVLTFCSVHFNKSEWHWLKTNLIYIRRLIRWIHPPFLHLTIIIILYIQVMHKNYINVHNFFQFTFLLNVYTVFRTWIFYLHLVDKPLLNFIPIFRLIMYCWETHTLTPNWWRQTSQTSWSWYLTLEGNNPCQHNRHYLPMPLYHALSRALNLRNTEF